MTPPPIVVLPEILNGDDHKTTVACLQKLVSGISYVKFDFSLKYSKNYTYIYTENKQLYERILKYMQFQDQVYFTFKPPWNKSKQIILKGIFTTDCESEIIDDLATKGIICLKIDAIGERWQSSDSPIYLLELAEDTNLEEVKEIRVICCSEINMGIMWQDYVETRNRPIQCYRCQRFHHRANYCYMTPQCVVCAEEHFSKDCKKSNENIPKCFNCNGEHRADDRSCPEWLSYKERLFANKDKNLQRKALMPRLTTVTEKNSAPVPKQTTESEITVGNFKFSMDKLAGWTSFLDGLKTSNNPKR